MSFKAVLIILGLLFIFFGGIVSYSGLFFGLSDQSTGILIMMGGLMFLVGGLFMKKKVQ